MLRYKLLRSDPPVLLNSSSIFGDNLAVVGEFSDEIDATMKANELAELEYRVMFTVVTSESEFIYQALVFNKDGIKFMRKNQWPRRYE